MIFIFSVSDVVAGDYIAIFTRNDRSYYVGWYNDSESRKMKLVPETLLPRDLMASTYHGANTKGAVKLGTVIFFLTFYTCLLCWFKIWYAKALSDICQLYYGARIPTPSWVTGPSRLELFTSHLLSRNVNMYLQFISSATLARYK